MLHTQKRPSSSLLDKGYLVRPRVVLGKIGPERTFSASDLLAFREKVYVTWLRCVRCKFEDDFRWAMLGIVHHRTRCCMTSANNLITLVPDHLAPSTLSFHRSLVCAVS
jgi:hypothetical protein